MNENNNLIKCGDIIKTPFGTMIVELIDKSNVVHMYKGHELKKIVVCGGQNIEILNSEFRYVKDVKSKIADELKRILESEYTDWNNIVELEKTLRGEK